MKPLAKAHESVKTHERGFSAGVLAALAVVVLGLRDGCPLKQPRQVG